MLAIFNNKLVRIIVVLILVVAIIGVSVITYTTRGLKTYRNMTILDVDLSTISDGIYTGIFDGGRWSNTVAVTVKDHKITVIQIMEGYSNTDINQIIFDEVIEKQSPNVDAVTGATVSSKAIMKAVEDALTNAGK
jgi:uncharacterized protein with FMN-binding domain